LYFRQETSLKFPEYGKLHAIVFQFPTFTHLKQALLHFGRVYEWDSLQPGKKAEEKR